MAPGRNRCTHDWRGEFRRMKRSVAGRYSGPSIVGVLLLKSPTALPPPVRDHRRRVLLRGVAEVLGGLDQRAGGDVEARRVDRGALDAAPTAAVRPLRAA